jgi:hypothetical protein
MLANESDTSKQAPGEIDLETRDRAVTLALNILDGILQRVEDLQREVMDQAWGFAAERELDVPAALAVVLTAQDVLDLLEPKRIASRATALRKNGVGAVRRRCRGRRRQRKGHHEYTE